MSTRSLGFSDSLSSVRLLNWVVKETWPLLNSLFDELRKHHKKDSGNPGVLEMPPEIELELRKALYGAPVYDVCLTLVGALMGSSRYVVVNHKTIATATEKLDRSELERATAFQGSDLEFVLASVGKALEEMLRNSQYILVDIGDDPLVTLQFEEP